MNPLLSVSVPFILASQSPRRRTLLEQLELSFTVEAPPVDETIQETLPPSEQAERLAARKADSVAEHHSSALVLAADTLVIHDGAVLGKPESPSHAREMLRTLSHRPHTVYTGLALAHADTKRSVQTGAATTVTLGPLDEEEIRAYVDTGSPLDKAGGYGIQDQTAPLLVEELHGDYYNVVGLPLRLLYVTLREHFGDLVELHE